MKLREVSRAHLAPERNINCNPVNIMNLSGTFSLLSQRTSEILSAASFSVSLEQNLVANGSFCTGYFHYEKSKKRRKQHDALCGRFLRRIFWLNEREADTVCTEPLKNQYDLKFNSNHWRLRTQLHHSCLKSTPRSKGWPKKKLKLIKPTVNFISVVWSFLLI